MYIYVFFICNKLVVLQGRLVFMDKKKSFFIHSSSKCENLINILALILDSQRQGPQNTFNQLIMTSPNFPLETG